MATCHCCSVAGTELSHRLPLWRVADWEQKPGSAATEWTRPAPSRLRGRRSQDRSHHCLVPTRPPPRQHNDLDRRGRRATHRQAQLHHEPATAPPADPARSITMHDLRNSRLVANPIDRYPVGDRTPVPARCCIVAWQPRTDGSCSRTRMGRSRSAPTRHGPPGWCPSFVIAEAGASEIGADRRGPRFAHCTSRLATASSPAARQLPMQNPTSADTRKLDQ